MKTDTNLCSCCRRGRLHIVSGVTACRICDGVADWPSQKDKK